ncbi:MAG: hypothetical protein IKJ28_00930, partial [Alphaproteobacteria bacterium]|nr:hypothetical protein [Alphaproteobacteria bacterium]
NSWMCCLKESIVSGLCCTHVGENGECCDSNNKCCPADKPLRDKDGNCYVCDDETQVNVEGTVENCAVCSNRLVSGSKKHCVLKCGLKGTSNENKPLMDTNGKCHACNEEVNVNVTKVTDNCNKCSNRYLVTGTFSGDYCALCGVAGSTVEDKKILDTWGVCQSCDASNLINVHGIESSCLSICPNRTLVGDKCYREYCSETVPLEDIDGKCHPCNEPLPIDVGGDETKCSCINRTLDGQYCILNGSKN